MIRYFNHGSEVCFVVTGNYNYTASLCFFSFFF